MSQNSLPENVPDAKQGEVVSVAAPGSAGVGGTNSPAKESALDEFRQVFRMMVNSSFFWALIPLNLAFLMLANWQDMMTWWAKDTPFSVVEDWSEFLGFVVVYSIGNLMDGLRAIVQGFCV